MYTRFHHFHRFSVASAAAILMLAVACTGGDAGSTDANPTSTAVGTISGGSTIVPTGTVTAGPGDRGDRTVVVPTATAVPGNVQNSSEEPATRQTWPEGQPVEQSAWVRERLAAMKAIFGFTPAGEEWIDGYDLRQMSEQPAWFGSFGYGSWAGAGEAVPRSVLHEISHSYWGAFSIERSPELSWDTSDGTAEALSKYREQLGLFMLQPPDRFEPLRDRFRNLPGLNNGEYPDLFHFGEADLIYMVGGNLQLVPPILRPYFSGFLAQGGAGAGEGFAPQSWDDALSWFNALPTDEWRIAGELFGLQHFPTGPYVDLPKSKLSGLDDDLRTVYEGEERQRLIDFAEQFDGILDREFSLVDAAGADRGFDFWRSYLSDKLSLHGRHPEVLRSAGSERGNELATALDFYADITSLGASEQAERFRESESQSLVAELGVLLRPRAIVSLFSDPDAENGILAVLGSRAERLKRLVEVVERVDEINSAPASGSVVAAIELERFMHSVPEDELRSDAFLLFDLLRSARSGLAKSVLHQLSDDALQFLLRVQPAAARSFEITPKRLLAAVGISDGVSLEQVRSGATLLSASSSGNFAIDSAYDAAVFVHLDRFLDSDPDGVLATVLESGTRLVPWVARESDGALRAMRARPGMAADALAQLSGSRETPWRIIHLVAREDPSLAARLAIEMDGRAGDSLERAIREFGYDLYWSERNSGPNVEPKRFAEFLLALDQDLGSDALDEAVSNAVTGIEADVTSGLIEPGAMEEFSRTAEAAMDSVRGSDAETLRTLFVSAKLVSDG